MTSLLQMSTNYANPRLGNGLLIRLSLPNIAYSQDLAQLAISLNISECNELTRSAFIGSWCVLGEGRLTYVSFLPNVAYAPGLVSNLCFYMASRSKWVSAKLLRGNLETRSNSAGHAPAGANRGRMAVPKTSTDGIIDRRLGGGEEGKRSWVSSIRSMWSRYSGT